MSAVVNTVINVFMRNDENKNFLITLDVPIHREFARETQRQKKEHVAPFALEMTPLCLYFFPFLVIVVFQIGWSCPMIASMMPYLSASSGESHLSLSISSSTCA